MNMIGAVEIEDAIRRLSDFQAVLGVDPEALEALKKAVSEGEGAVRAFVASRIYDEERGAEMVARLRLLAEGAGLSIRGKDAFTLGMLPELQPLYFQPIDNAVETAAFMGLIVGLFARQLADEGEAP